MIVRISGEGQYELDDSAGERLDELQSAALAAVESGSEAEFSGAFGALIAFVRNTGTAVPEDELLGSDVILPPADLGYEEARAGGEFTGEGLSPD
jgi:hypothetical protein